MSKTLLFKISGEALKGETDGIHDPLELKRVCSELLEAVNTHNAKIAVVVGGGNILRGATLAGKAADPTRGDYMGMLATLINALALKDSIETEGGKCEVYGPNYIPNVCKQYNRSAVMECLDNGTIVVFGGGTGHPFFTTDTTAALRAAEINASFVLKGSNVDGIYTKDPNKFDDAEFIEALSFDEAIAKRFAVMDQAAFAICRDRNVSIQVFDMRAKGNIIAVAGDNPPGTSVTP